MLGDALGDATREARQLFKRPVSYNLHESVEDEDNDDGEEALNNQEDEDNDDGEQDVNENVLSILALKKV